MKFSAKGRILVVRILCREINSNEVPGLNGLRACYETIVEDNGIGFNKAYKERIFNSFERLNNFTEFPGFGLGLSLCKKIVMNHEGKVTVPSEEGVGKFCIYLPAKVS